MSALKNPKKNPENAGNSSNSRRCPVDNERLSAPRKSLLSCCSKKPIRSGEPLDFDSNEFDYIVEKLVIKRVPIGLFATSYDDYGIASSNVDRKPLIVADPQKVYSIVPAVNSSLFYTNTNGAGVSGFPTRPSAKNLRFASSADEDDAFVDGDQLTTAASSDYRSEVERRFRDAESLNRFTSLHPNLKESERPPKDPCPLNTTKSRRSLAEEISEIAAKKDRTDSHYERTRNEILTTGSVYTAQSGASRDLETEKTDKSSDKMPTREKSEAERTPSNRQKAGNSSCFPFGWLSADNRPDENDASISRTDESLEDVDSSFGPSRSQNFTIAPVQVHYTSPNLEAIRKIIQEDRRRVDAIDRSKLISDDFESKKNDSPRILGESATGGVSRLSEESRIDDSVGTTLRWKIIIKHNPPESPKISGISRSSNNASRIPTLSQTLRNVIEADVHKQPSRENNDRNREYNKRELYKKST